MYDEDITQRLNISTHVLAVTAKNVNDSQFEKMQKYSEKMSFAEIALRHESAYDEMVGQPVKNGNNRLEVPLAKNPYSVLKHLH